MHRDNDRYKAFSRRAFMLLGGNVLLLSGLVARMYQLQVIEGERLAVQRLAGIEEPAVERGPLVWVFSAKKAARGEVEIEQLSCQRPAVEGLVELAGELLDALLPHPAQGLSPNGRILVAEKSLQDIKGDLAGLLHQ